MRNISAWSCKTHGRISAEKMNGPKNKSCPFCGTKMTKEKELSANEWAREVPSSETKWRKHI